MQEVIIADTSCLILLSKIDKLHLLNLLYGEITITSVIAAEYRFPLPAWIVITDPTNNIIRPGIDPGETSAINLAVERKNSLLILDDSKARLLAKKLKVNYTGTLGILIDAKESGFVSSLQSVLAEIKKTNFHISEDLEQKVLKLSGEI